MPARRPGLPAADPLSASPDLLIKAGTLAAALCLVQRRSFAAIRAAGRPSVRSREVIWCILEALDAALAGRRMSHKDLAALAAGVISPATLTRALDRAEARGFLLRRPDAADARVVLLEPTPAAYAVLLHHAESVYGELATMMRDAEAQLARLR